MTLEERVSTLEAELAELRTLLAPTRQRADLVKQSKEQAKRTDDLSAIKRTIMEAQVDGIGRTYCERCAKNCRPALLALHHKRARSLRGGDSRDNLILVCPACHAAEETPEAISSRRESQQGAAGKCEKLLKNRLSE